MSETNFKIGKSLQLPVDEGVRFGDDLILRANALANTISFHGGVLSTTNYVDTAIANLIDSAPSTLDTLNEIAAALNDSANIANVLFAYIDNAVSNIDVPEGFITSASNSFGVNSGELSLASGVAGPGIGYNEGRLEVNAANGLIISNDSVVLDTSTVAGPGLYPMDGGTLTVNAGNGLTIVDDALVLAVSNAFFTSGGDGLLRLVPDVAGSGLGFNENIISVNVANGLTISNDSVQISNSLAGSHLSLSQGVMSVNLDSLTPVIHGASGLAGAIVNSKLGATVSSANTWTTLTPMSSQPTTNYPQGEFIVSIRTANGHFRTSKITYVTDSTDFVSYNEYAIVEGGPATIGVDVRVVKISGNHLVQVYLPGEGSAVAYATMLNPLLDAGGEGSGEGGPGGGGEGGA